MSLAFNIVEVSMAGIDRLVLKCGERLASEMGGKGGQLSKNVGTKKTDGIG